MSSYTRVSPLPTQSEYQADGSLRADAQDDDLYSPRIPDNETRWISTSIRKRCRIYQSGIFLPLSTMGHTELQNVGLPALIFSSVVSAFTPDNIAAFGPLAMVAVLYMVIGLALGWIVREVFYVPHDFHYGILVVSSFLAGRCCS